MKRREHNLIVNENNQYSLNTKTKNMHTGWKARVMDQAIWGGGGRFLNATSNYPWQGMHGTGNC